MIDALVVLAIGLLLVRGWYRGFIREGMDLAVLVVGAVLAFRLAGPVGSVVAAVSDISPDVARFIGGILVFFAVGIAGAIGVRWLEQTTRLPGLNVANRIGGAGLAAAWGLFLTTIFLTLAVVLPMPTTVANAVDDSAVARTLTDPDGLPQSVFNGLAGDGIIETVLELRHLVGTRQVVIEGDEAVEFPPADPNRLEPDPESARRIFDLVNESRIEAGVDPIAWSDALVEVGEGHARDMYVNGYFSHVSPTTGTVADRLFAAGITYRIAGENLALAATPDDTHRGLMDSPGHRRNILLEDYTRVGIAVIDGPLGLMTVQVFTG